MKVLINNQQHGGFFIKKDAIKKVFGKDSGFMLADYLRANADLIAMKESGEDIEDEGWCDLAVVEVPEDATDWMVLTDCDGVEALYAVVDGKIICCG